MRAVKVSQEAQVNRMFESDFFEFFSHIHPWQPPVIYVPLISYISWRAIQVGTGAGAFVGLFLVGLIAWTILEYTLHRFAFHYKASTKFGQKLVWFLHGVHHDWPHDRLRLVFPPTVSLPLALAVWGLFTMIFGEIARYAAFAGILTGYLTYDMIHYYVHHFAPKNRAAKYLRRYHLAHHFKTPDAAYGVSSPLWDLVFRSGPGDVSDLG